jgi:hypothetical protein
LNTLIALNSGTAPDVSGPFLSLGHNLIGATNGSSGFPMSGDLVGSIASPLDPKVGPLANNGGPTLTIALLPGSPAIDAGDSAAAPPTDQRGFPRPFGRAADIGAFEFSSPELQASRASAGGTDIVGTGKAGQTCRLLASTNLTTWFPIATNQISTNGTVLVHDSSSDLCRFYRLVTP